MKILTIALFAILLSAFIVAAQDTELGSNPPSMESVEVENEWDGKVFSVRRVYVLMPENSFDVETVTNLIRKISMDFPVPRKLEISVFTNRNRLSEFRVYEGPGLIVCFFPTTKEERRALEVYDEMRRPKPVGHFARYYRDESGTATLFKTQKSGDDYLIPVETMSLPKN